MNDELVVAVFLLTLPGLPLLAAVVVSFADGRATVLENGTMVSLVLVATGAEVGAAFTVQVDPTEAVPPSARGGRGWVGGAGIRGASCVT